MIPTFIMFIFTQEITLLKGSPLYRSGVFMLWGWKLLFVYTESYCFLNSMFILSLENRKITCFPLNSNA